jgi:hypothetical protein
MDSNEITITVGPMLFQFDSFEHWVNHASTEFAKAAVAGHHCLCVDAKGRLLIMGKQFMRSRDDGSFPVKVYRKVVS